MDLWRDHLMLVLAGAGVVLCLLSLCFWCLLRWRCKPRYEYAVLEDEAALQDKIELDRKQQRDAERNIALMNCQFYLRSSAGCRFHFLRQLNDIGRRLDKHWFVVSDSATGAERLMSLARVHCGRRWAGLVQEILRASHHPYILPVLELCAPDNLLCITSPLNPSGSLKDLLYHADYLKDWRDKYSYPGTPLPEPHIQQLGSQILEGLMFLREQGLTSFGHLHTGNVILQNGVARLAGLENTLLGLKSSLHILFERSFADAIDALDTFCFGHVLFEMGTGAELLCASPTERDFVELAHHPRVSQIVKFIFHWDRFPTIPEIACLEFFRLVDLRELSSHLVQQPVALSPEALSLLATLHSCPSDSRLAALGPQSQSTSALESWQTPGEIITGELKKTKMSSSDSRMYNSPPQGKKAAATEDVTHHSSSTTEYYTAPTTPKLKASWCT